jgi:hypothetical protein
MRLRGTLNWPGFGKQGEDWLGFIFIIDGFSGEPHGGNHEGTLEWVPREKLLELPMWEGDRHFLPLVFDDDPRCPRPAPSCRPGRCTCPGAGRRGARCDGSSAPAGDPARARNRAWRLSACRAWRETGGKRPV